MRNNRLDRTRILSASEIRQVVERMQARKKRSHASAANLIIFRLSCCCGLRRKEIAGLLMQDLVLAGDKPFVHVRAEITKGREGRRRARKVPLWWDRGTHDDILSWHSLREEMGSGDQDPFVCSMRAGYIGRPLAKEKVASRWGTVMRQCLPPQRAKMLSTHSGRHSFCSHAIHIGRSPAEVRDAAGHSSISVTDIYAHAIDREGIPDVFG